MLTVQLSCRAGLLDPKWIEQRDRQISEKREQEEVYAAGASIGGNLKLLAERRTDIFGSGAEEAQIGKKVRWFVRLCSVLQRVILVVLKPQNVCKELAHVF